MIIHKSLKNFLHQSAQYMKRNVTRAGFIILTASPLTSYANLDLSAAEHKALHELWGMVLLTVIHNIPKIILLAVILAGLYKAWQLFRLPAKIEPPLVAMAMFKTFIFVAPALMLVLYILESSPLYSHLEAEYTRIQQERQMPKNK